MAKNEEIIDKYADLEEEVIKHGIKRSVSFSIQEPGSATSSDSVRTPSSDDANHDFPKIRRDTFNSKNIEK